MIADIEDYFSKGCGRCDRFDTKDCSTKSWARGLATLRDICLSAGLVEAVKWGQPCYSYAKRNVERSDTRVECIAVFRDRIFDGKGATET
ncbi:hypothetical protein [Salinarimonas chemoclinalis]|uniref:hypothetical protein n=1 Tax=Salinarimonas chemoclinalis TaxID=3241599 RepID=UPI0035571281